MYQTKERRIPSDNFTVKSSVERTDGIGLPFGRGGVMRDRGNDTRQRYRLWKEIV